MRSPNWFWTSDRFVSIASWRDRAGPFVVWPSLMVETQVDLGADVQSTRWTLSWGRRRGQIDFARWLPHTSDGKIDWSASPGGVEDMFRWAKRVFRQSWTRADLEKLFVQQPEWRRIVVQSGTGHHYVRVLLARELMAQDTGVIASEALPVYTSSAEQLAAALLMPKNDEKLESEWSNASLDAARPRHLRPLGTVEGQDPMEQLDHLANLLDLPQEVRDLGGDPLTIAHPAHQTLDEASTKNVNPSLVLPASTQDAVPVVPSYLMKPTTPEEAEVAQRLSDLLNNATPFTSAPDTPPSLPSYLPPAVPAQEEAARNLANALERARKSNSDDQQR